MQYPFFPKLETEQLKLVTEPFVASENSILSYFFRVSALWPSGHLVGPTAATSAALLGQCGVHRVVLSPMSHLKLVEPAGDHIRQLNISAKITKNFIIHDKVCGNFLSAGRLPRWLSCGPHHGHVSNPSGPWWGPLDSPGDKLSKCGGGTP